MAEGGGHHMERNHTQAGKKREQRAEREEKESRTENKNNVKRTIDGRKVTRK